MSGLFVRSDQVERCSSWMILLHIAELSMAIEADHDSRSVVFAASDVMIFEAARIGLCANDTSSIAV
jgi:hypothetical protein